MTNKLQKVNKMLSKYVQELYIHISELKVSADEKKSLLLDCEHIESVQEYLNQPESPEG